MRKPAGPRMYPATTLSRKGSPNSTTSQAPALPRNHRSMRGAAWRVLRNARTNNIASAAEQAMARLLMNVLEAAHAGHTHCAPSPVLANWLNVRARTHNLAHNRVTEFNNGFDQGTFFMFNYFIFNSSFHHA